VLHIIAHFVALELKCGGGGAWEPSQLETPTGIRLGPHAQCQNGQIHWYSNGWSYERGSQMTGNSVVDRGRQNAGFGICNDMSL
jgi:hypothetical protein